MSDFLPLFDAKPAEDSTYSVLQLNNAIDQALKDRFAQEIWVRGEIQGLARTRMRKHWYFELVEKEIAGDGVRAKLSVALLSWNRRDVDRAVAATVGFDLDDGIEVRIKGRVGYYPPFGKLQFEMTGIDPTFTLGQMAANRERILKSLAREELLDRNAGVAMPAVPQRIGLITSVGSAAYNDFVRELELGGFGHRVEVIDARVQGPEAEPTIVAALASFAARRPDVVVMIRGGGSQSDLAGFDSERIARSIARMPVPVLTGIGHEIDISVADHVAHSSYKTPTAVASAIVGRTRLYLEAVGESWQGIATAATSQLEESSRRLLELARGTSRGAVSAITHRHRDLREVLRRIRREAPHLHERRRTALERMAGEIRAAGKLGTARQRERLRRAATAVTRERLLALIERRGDRLVQGARRVAARAPLVASRRAASLDAQAARVRALDPKRVLARGYSLSYDASGKLVRGVGGAAVGSRLSTHLVDGMVHSKIEQIESQGQEEESS